MRAECVWLNCHSDVEHQIFENINHEKAWTDILIAEGGACGLLDAHAELR